jgi:formylglycine-generating enzyme required for sulfatase activity
MYLPSGELDPIPEQLVVVEPFFLDIDEMTVGEFRATGLTSDYPPKAKGPGPAEMCTYTDAPGGNETMPLNCVGFLGAEAACKQLGKRLPTEAEWEWAAGNLERETPFPWLGQFDPCARAIVARGRINQEEDTGCLGASGASGVPGPQAGGSAGDATELGVMNLAGNLSEWLSDTFTPYASSACWGASPTVHGSGPCAAPSTRRVVRGGDWSGAAAEARVTGRNGAPTPGYGDTGIGLRCAK